MCSGKVYYDLFEEREKRGIRDVYLLRVEQLYPFPARAARKELSRFPRADVVWCQEEPRNMGAWTFVEPRVEDALVDIGHGSKRPRYVGRTENGRAGAGHDEAARQTTGGPRGRGPDVVDGPRRE